MQYRILGQTGLYVSALCLGTMTFGGRGIWQAIGRLAQAEADAIVGRAMDAGVNFIDTANVYSEGESERLLGVALKGKRERVIVATKAFGRVGQGINEIGLSRGHILSAVEDSLRRLDTDYIDLYQVHGFDPVTPLDQTLRALDDLVHSGKVRYIGCSNFAAWQIMKALGISDKHGLARFESVQAYYTIAGRDLEREVVPVALDQNLSVLVWSPLAGGLLSGKFERDSSPDGARRTTFDFPPVNRDRAFDCVDVMREIAAETGASVPQIALAWLLQRPTVTSVIIGAKSVEQLDDNLKAVEVTLTPEQVARLDTVSALPAEYPQWMLERQQGNGRPAVTTLKV